MATGLIYADGFDYYTNNDTSATKSPHANWSTAAETSGVLSARSTASRHSTGRGMLVPNNRRAMRVLGATYSEVIVGSAANWVTASDNNRLFWIYDGPSIQFYVIYESSTKTFKCYRGDNTLVGTSTATASNLAGTWGFVELAVKCHSSTGTAILRVNGTQILSLTSINTGQSGANQCTAVGCNHPNSGSDLWVDDFYVLDKTVSGADFLGPVRIEGRFADGAGNSAQMTATGAASNYQCVDEDQPNDDTDYVTSNTVGHKDTHTIQNPTQRTGTVFAVALSFRGRCESGGARSMCNVARSSGSETDGSAYAMSTDYLWYQSIYDTKPGGGSWDVSSVDGMEAGYKITA